MRLLWGDHGPKVLESRERASIWVRGMCLDTLSSGYGKTGAGIGVLFFLAPGDSMTCVFRGRALHRALRGVRREGFSYVPLLDLSKGCGKDVSRNSLL